MLRNVKIVLNEGSVGACQLGSMTVLPGKRGPKIYMYGGLSTVINVGLIEARTYNNTFQESHPWREGKISLGRFGHSMHRFCSKRFLVYGGEIGTSRKDFTMSQSKLYKILGMFLYNSETKKVHRLAKKSSSAPRPRKFHASCLLGKRFLLIFGGIEARQVSAKNEIRSSSLSDFWVFDLLHQIWYNFVLSSYSKNWFSEGIIFHQMASGYKYSISQGECLMSKTNKMI
jgi:hypothetical protein